MPQLWMKWPLCANVQKSTTDKLQRKWQIQGKRQQRAQRRNAENQSD